MGDPLDARPSQAPSARRRRRGGLLWATLALAAAGGLFATRRARGPETGGYRLERIDRGPIRSEVTVPGTVKAFTPVQVDVGQAFGPGLAALFTIPPDLSRVPVEASVGEPDVGRVAAGEVATLRCPAYPGVVLTGTVSEVLLTPGETQGVVGHTVVVEADDRDHKLLPGMTASVSIELARREGVLRLPLRAVGFTPPGMERAAPATPPAGRVFVLDHGQPRPVRVTVGLQDLLHVELVAGPLGEGDAVIVDQAW